MGTDPIDRDDIAADLDRARVQFHRLLQAVQPDEWHKATLGTRWTNEQLLFHMVFGYMVVQRLLPRSPRPRPGGRSRCRATGAATPLRSPSSIRSGTARSATPKAAPSSSASPVAEKVLAIFTTDTTSDTETVVARYADRWPIEVAIAGGKQLLGIGQARNRLQRAVERTVPLSFCVYSLVVVWYTLHGYHPDDLTGRRADQPWYSHKDDIAFEDMLAKLRRSLVAARITGVDAAQPDPRKYRDYELACAAAAA